MICVRHACTFANRDPSLHLKTDDFYRATLCVSAVLAVAPVVYVRLCPSVTLVYCISLLNSIAFW